MLSRVGSEIGVVAPDTNVYAGGRRPYSSIVAGDADRPYWQAKD